MTTETTTAPKPNGAQKANGAAAPETIAVKVPAAKIVKHLAAGMHPNKVADKLGVHISTVYYHRKGAIQRGELKGRTRQQSPPKKAKGTPKTPGKRGPKAAQRESRLDALVFFHEAQDGAAPELRRVSNHALLVEIGLRYLDGRMR